MDPLSTVMALLRPRNYLSAGFAAGGDWAVQFPPQDKGIKTGAIVAGQCWLVVEGAAEPVFLRTGEGFLLPSGRPFLLASDPGVAPVAASAVFSGLRTDGIHRLDGGNDFLILSNRFGLSDSHGALLLRMLPPIVHLRPEPGGAGQGHDALRWLVERMMQEMRDPQPGGHLVIEHLAHMMLVQALRLHLAEGPRGGVGWLFALADRQMSRAMNAIHADPARRWTLKDLAAEAGMSRSTFALRFKETVGSSPMDYLLRWRMVLAGDRLENSRDPIAVIAPSLGYESEAAFSTAFKRVMGASPRHYGRGRSAFQPDSQPDDPLARAMQVG